MAAFKLADDFELTCTLLGIQTGLEDYLLAYRLNQYLDLRLQRDPSGTPIEGLGQLPRFEYDDSHAYLKWCLVPNKVHSNPGEEEDFQVGLFQNRHLTSTRYVLEEFPKIDYFLRIEGEEEPVCPGAKSAVQRIPGIRWVSQIDPARLKTKALIIF